MRIPIFSRFVKSPFEELVEHAEKVKECTWLFQQAMECYVSDNCKSFTEIKAKVLQAETEADEIKRQLRDRISNGPVFYVNKFNFLMYLKEQDHILDAVEQCLNWLDYRPEPDVLIELKKEFFLLVDAIIDPIEELCNMVEETRVYFNTLSEKQRRQVNKTIQSIHEKEYDADKAEDIVKKKIFSLNTDPVVVFHMVRLVESIGQIADRSENAGDILHTMLVK